MHAGVNDAGRARRGERLDDALEGEDGALDHRAADGAAFDQLVRLADARRFPAVDGCLDEGRGVVERLDGVLGGLLEAWDDASGLIVITSDHGNLEDLSHKHHTPNLVPTLIIGDARREFPWSRKIYGTGRAGGCH